MQTSIKEHFAGLRQSSNTTRRAIEEMADSVARMLFRSPDKDRRSLVTRALSDDEALSEEKKKVTISIPTSEEIQSMVQTFAFTSDAFSVGCKAILDTPRPIIVPMAASSKTESKEVDETPATEAIVKVDAIHARLLATTTDTELCKKITLELEEAQKVADQRINEVIRASIDYWEKAALKTLARLVSGTAMEGAQASEAKRVAAEMASYIESIRPKIITLSVLIASANGNEDRIQIVRGLAGRLYHGVTMSIKSTFFDQLTDCLKLPRNRGPEMCRVAIHELYMGM